MDRDDFRRITVNSDRGVRLYLDILCFAWFSLFGRRLVAGPFREILIPLSPEVWPLLSIVVSGYPIFSVFGVKRINRRVNHFDESLALPVVLLDQLFVNSRHFVA